MLLKLLLFVVEEEIWSQSCSFKVEKNGGANHELMLDVCVVVVHAAYIIQGVVQENVSVHVAYIIQGVVQENVLACKFHFQFRVSKHTYMLLKSIF